MHSGKSLWTKFVQIYFDGKYFWTVRFDTAQMTLTLFKITGVARKHKVCENYLTQFSIDRDGTCLRLLGLMNDILCWLINSQGRELYLRDFVTSPPPPPHFPNNNI